MMPHEQITTDELNIIDGNTSIGTNAISNGDGIITNDSGTMRQTTVQTFQTYFDANSIGGTNIVTVGTLNAGSITSGFGNIDNGSSNIITGGILTIDEDTTIVPASDTTGINSTGSLTIGSSNDAGLYVYSDSLYIENKTNDKDIIFRINDNNTYKTILTIDGSENSIIFNGNGLNIQNGSTSAGFINLYENSSNGTNSIKIISPESLSGDLTLTLPSNGGNILSSGDTSSITNDMLVGSIANSKLNNSAVTVTAGNGLSGGGSVSLGGTVSFAVGVDDSSIEINSDALRVKASGITNAMLAGSIANSKLSNSAVTVTAGDGLSGCI